MSRLTHAIYIWTMVIIVVAVTAYMSFIGYDYYTTPLHERFYHPNHNWFKPSGIYGHGVGILGTLLMVIGVFLYIARKRYNFMVRYLRMKYLLEFHIFLCTLGPILVLFHTAFKFGGLVSVSFWSMVAVVISGVIGRFIYIQIPRTIEGRELSLSEVKGRRSDLIEKLKSSIGLDEQSANLLFEEESGNGKEQGGGSPFSSFRTKRKTIKTVKTLMAEKQIGKAQQNSVLRMLKEEFSLAARIGRLERMQKLFQYWHVAHMPFALIMLIILVIHVIVTLTLGYTWIF